MNNRLCRIVAIAVLLGGSLATIAMKKSDEPLVVYCGRGEEMIRPLMEMFQQQSGIAVQVRYGGTAELAATLLEEGSRSPADVFFAQDAGALGALKKMGRLDQLDEATLSRVAPRYRSPDGVWIGISGRARVVVYNTQTLTEADLPDDIHGFCDPKWKGRLGWAPENGSFQAFVTALRIREGDAKVLAWLNCIQANQPRVFAKNSAIVAAVAAGEIDVGFVNHYYLFGALKTQPALKAANYYFPRENAGSLMNVAGVGILKTAKNKDAAKALVEFLLSPEAQTYLANETCEYPLIDGIALREGIPPLNEIPTLDIDLNRLDDLEGALQLIHQAGVL